MLRMYLTSYYWQMMQIFLVCIKILNYYMNKLIVNYINDKIDSL